MPELFKILVSKVGDQVLVIAIKQLPSEWHYFDECDRALDRHPEFIQNKLSSLSLFDGLNIEIIELDEEEEQKYYCRETGVFVYEDKPLKTVDPCETMPPKTMPFKTTLVENKSSAVYHVLTSEPRPLAYPLHQYAPSSDIRESEQPVDQQNTPDQSALLRFAADFVSGFVSSPDAVESSPDAVECCCEFACLGGDGGDCGDCDD